jgi:mRNA interferase RelE/StbE
VRAYSIELAPTAFRSLRDVKNRKIQRELARVVDGLAKKPEEQGKPLAGPLEGVLSVRAARDRYRILYKVDAGARRVSVLLIGRRKPGEERDVYAVARRLFETLAGGTEGD